MRDTYQATLSTPYTLSFSTWGPLWQDDAEIGSSSLQYNAGVCVVIMTYMGFNVKPSLLEVITWAVYGFASQAQHRAFDFCEIEFWC